MATYTQLLNTKRFKEALEYAEHEVFARAYGYCGLNQVQTAKLLGVARGTLITKLKQMDLL